METIVIEPNQIEVFVQKSGLELEAANSVKNAFAPLWAEAEKWKAKVDSIVITDVSQLREMKLARETRLALKEVRVKAEKTRKTLKEDSLRKGKAIDGVYNVLEFFIVPLEKQLEDMEKFAERKEDARKTALAAERTEKLLPFGRDLTHYNLRDMEDVTFEDLLNGTRMAQEARKEAELKAEAERIEAARKDAEDRERQRQENERLKAEAEAREKVLAEERAKAAQAAKEAAEKAAAERKAAEDARKAAEAQARKEREALEAKARAEKEAAEEVLRQERAAAAAKQAEADKARKAAEAALAKQKADEAKRLATEKEAARKAALAPDKEKILAFAAELRAIAIPNIAQKAALLSSVDRCWNELQELAESL